MFSQERRWSCEGFNTEFFSRAIGGLAPPEAGDRAPMLWRRDALFRASPESYLLRQGVLQVLSPPSRGHLQYKPAIK